MLVVSFVALGVLWRKPLLERVNDARPLPTWAQRILLGPELRILLGALSFGLLVLVFAAATFGEDSVATNIAPTFVYVVFWLGLVPVVVLLGNVWPALNPWKAAADAVAWVGERTGAPWRAPLRLPERVGCWPAAVTLFLFPALELCYPQESRPRTLAVAILAYSWITWLGMALFGRRAWLASGEGFTAYFGLLARLAPFAVRDGVVVARPPLVGLAGPDRRPGIVAVLAVMLGSVAFDSFSETTWWQERLFSIEAPLALDNPGLADLAVTFFNLAGLVGAVSLVALAFLLAVEGARLAGRARNTLVDQFALSLVPIALAYAVAHYFSLLVRQGQVTWRLASDPFGFGWDLFGTADWQPNQGVLSANTIWYVQAATLVSGHVLGLVLAHDRAVAIFRSPGRALRTQYAMLVLMILYTVGGLWLLWNA